MGTRNTVTRTIFGENALTLHFLGLASSGCFDYVVAFAPTALNMTEGEGLEKLRVPRCRHLVAESLLHPRCKHASLNSPRVFHLDKDVIVAPPGETIRE
jgi:hypothetical protein